LLNLLLLTAIVTPSIGESPSTVQTEYSCVPEAATIALRILGISVTYSELLQEIPIDTNKGGASVADLVRSCERRGVSWQASKVTNPKELASLLSSDRVVVAITQGEDRTHAVCLLDSPEGILAVDLYGQVRLADKEELNAQLAKGLVCVALERRDASRNLDLLANLVLAGFIIALLTTIVVLFKNQLFTKRVSS
jgi:hypothetical protein